MTEAEAAAALWGGRILRPVAERENAIFELALPQGRAALRLHRRGYQPDTAIRSELWWCAELAAEALPCRGRCRRHRAACWRFCLVGAAPRSSTGWRARPWASAGAAVRTAAAAASGPAPPAWRADRGGARPRPPPWRCRPISPARAGTVTDLSVKPRSGAGSGIIPPRSPDRGEASSRPRVSARTAAGRPPSAHPCRCAARERACGRRPAGADRLRRFRLGPAALRSGHRPVAKPDRTRLCRPACGLMEGYGTTDTEGMVETMVLARCCASVGWMIGRVPPGRPVTARFIARAVARVRGPDRRIRLRCANGRASQPCNVLT
jgi:hypothetical protein